MTNENLWIIEYSCAHWCGASNRVVVVADSEQEAVDKASYFMEEDMRELFYDAYAEGYNEDTEENIYDDESAVMVESVEPFGPEHDEWQYYMDPTQAEFYPVVS